MRILVAVHQCSSDDIVDLLSAHGPADTLFGCWQVLDAADFDKGPVATIWLKHRIPRGLHGHFCPEVHGPRQQ